MTSFVNAAEVLRRLTAERTRRSKDGSAMQCRVCWYVYEPEKGCPENGIPPETPFTALPAHWDCPRCGAERDTFLPVSEVKGDGL